MEVGLKTMIISSLVGLAAAGLSPGSASAAARWHVPRGALVPNEYRVVNLTNNGNIVIKVNTNLEQLTITCTQSTGVGSLRGDSAGNNGRAYFSSLSFVLANCTANLGCTVSEMMAVVTRYVDWTNTLSEVGGVYYNTLETVKLKTTVGGGGCTQSGTRELTGNVKSKVINGNPLELEFPTPALGLGMGEPELKLGINNSATLSGKYQVRQQLEPNVNVSVGA